MIDVSRTGDLLMFGESRLNFIPHPARTAPLTEHPGQKPGRSVEVHAVAESCGCVRVLSHISWISLQPRGGCMSSHPGSPRRKVNIGFYFVFFEPCEVPKFKRCRLCSELIVQVSRSKRGRGGGGGQLWNGRSGQEKRRKRQTQIRSVVNQICFSDVGYTQNVDRWSFSSFPSVPGQWVTIKRKM